MEMAFQVAPPGGGIPCVGPGRISWTICSAFNWKPRRETSLPGGCPRPSRDWEAQRPAVYHRVLGEAGGYQKPESRLFGSFPIQCRRIGKAVCAGRCLATAWLEPCGATPACCHGGCLFREGWPSRAWKYLFPSHGPACLCLEPWTTKRPNPLDEIAAKTWL